MILILKVVHSDLGLEADLEVVGPTSLRNVLQDKKLQLLYLTGNFAILLNKSVP